MMDPARYDGSRPEPPYNTDSDAVVALQDELDEMTADRDRLAAELATAHEEIVLSRQSEGETMADLLATRAELARVRRNHLRNQLKRAELHARVHTQIAKQGPMSTRPMSPKTLRRAARNRDRWRKVVDALRAALAQPQDGTTEGRSAPAWTTEPRKFDRATHVHDLVEIRPGVLEHPPVNPVEPTP